MVGLVPTEWAQRIKPADFWLLSILKHFEVPFVIVSGAATAFYGCRDDEYFDDLDIDLSPSKSNSRRFAKAMDQVARSAGLNAAPSFPEFLLAKSRVLFNLDKSECNIDFCTSRSSFEFNERYAASTSSMIGSMAIRIASLADLIKETELFVKNLNTVVAAHEADAQVIKTCISKAPIPTNSLVFPDDITQIFTRLAAADVTLLITGGIAAEFYGCENFNCSLRLELLLRPDVQSANNMLRALPEIIQQNSAKNLSEVSMQNLIKPNSRTRPFPMVDLDFLVAESESEFDQQLQNSFHTPVMNGFQLKIVSLPDMLANKEKQISFWQDKIANKSRDLKRLRELAA